MCAWTFQLSIHTLTAAQFCMWWCTDCVLCVVIILIIRAAEHFLQPVFRLFAVRVILLSRPICVETCVGVALCLCWRTDYAIVLNGNLHIFARLRIGWNSRGLCIYSEWRRFSEFWDRSICTSFLGAFIANPKAEMSLSPIFSRTHLGSYETNAFSDTVLLCRNQYYVVCIVLVLQNPANLHVHFVWWCPSELDGASLQSAVAILGLPSWG